MEGDHIGSRGLEATVEWLEMWGEPRKMELSFRMEVAEPEPRTQDPPEHMQIEKVTWRQRTLQDDFDDDENDEREDDYYDPLSYA
jgi:hypothetical protein